MARIYDAFNALGLGQAINGLHNGIGARNTSALQLLGGELKDYFAQRAEEQKEAARKQDAIDFLMGRGGMDEASARQFAGTVDPSEAVRYMQGRLDSKADKEDEREYQEQRYLDERADRIADRAAEWAHDFEDWSKKNGISYQQAVKQAQFGQLMQQLGVISAKDWGDSRKGVDQYNDTISAIKKFAEANPEYLDVLGVVNGSFGGGKGNGYFFEDKIKKLIENGGKDVTDAQREAILEDLENHGEFSNIIGDPRYTDAIAKFTANVDNRKLMPYIRLQKLIGNNTTQKQRNSQINSAAFEKKLNEVIKALKEESEKPFGEGRLPEGITPEIEKALKNHKDRTHWGRVLKLRGR